MRPRRILVRAVTLLEARGGVMPYDELTSHLWPLVEPGPAYRIREKDRARLAIRPTKSGKRVGQRACSTAEIVEAGARRRIQSSIKSWRRYGIIALIDCEGRKCVELLRRPIGMEDR